MVSKRKGRGSHKVINYPRKPNDKQKNALFRYLDRIYYDVNTGGSYSSVSKLLTEVRRRGHYMNVGLNRIKEYLNKQNAYSLYKPARTRFPTPPVHVTKINEQFEMDLMDVSRDSSFNDGVKFILTCIDDLSKYGFLIPLKSKEGSAVAMGTSKILEVRQPLKILTDRGSEFKSSQFQNVLRKKGIHHFFAGGRGAAPIVERFTRTIRSRIARYKYRYNTDRYIDVLQDIVKGYNLTYHRSIKSRPVDISENNDHIAYENIYSKRKPAKPVQFQFQIGDSVRISGAKHPFRREFFQRWSEEIFTINKRYRQFGINMYKIKDCADEEIVGSFYAPELAKVTTSDSDMYKIDRVIGHKIQNGEKYVKVVWKGYPIKCSSWVLQKSIKDVK